MVYFGANFVPIRTRVADKTIYRHLMKNIVLSILSILLLCTAVSAQESKKLQSAEKQLEELIQLIEKGDIDAVLQRTTDSLYCSLCFDAPTDTYRIAKGEFFSQHFSNIFTQDLLERIKRGKRITVEEKSPHHDILILYSIYARDELAPGHEGGQFGFWLKEDNGIFLLAGVETIP